MGSMDPYSSWPLPPYIQQCRRQQPFGGLYPYTGWDQQPFPGAYPGWNQQQQFMNQICGLSDPLQGFASRPEDLRQIEMWKCDYCGSRFDEKPEKCKNCGSNVILRFDDPGERARQMSDVERRCLEMETAFLGPIGMAPKQQSVSEAVAEFREEVAKITGPRRCWLVRCWERFIRALDRCGYR